MAKIYLSSTYSDLVDCREAVYRTLRQLRHDVVAMEDYVAADERPLDKCVADVADCDIYVGVFAWRYGFCPAGHEESITVLELKAAADAGKPCLIFLLDEDAPWSPRQIDADREAIEDLRSDLRRDHVVSSFCTADQLATLVSVAVTAEVEKAEEGGNEDGIIGGNAADDREPSRIEYYRTCLAKFTDSLDSQIRFHTRFGAALCTIGTITAAIGFTLIDKDVSMVAGVAGVLVATTTVFPVAVRKNKCKTKVLLDVFEAELAKETPAPEALTSVKTFVDQQLNLVLESAV